MKTTIACHHGGHGKRCPLWRRMGMSVIGPCECVCHTSLPWSKRIPALIEVEERAARTAEGLENA